MSSTSQNLAHYPLPHVSNMPTVIIRPANSHQAYNRFQSKFQQSTIRNLAAAKPPHHQQRTFSTSQNDLKHHQLLQSQQPPLHYKPPTMSTQSKPQLQSQPQPQPQANLPPISLNQKCSNCSQILGQGSAMYIEKLGLAFHLKCFRCSVCNVPLSNGKEGTDVRVSGANRLHCNNCFSNDLGNFLNLNNQTQTHNFNSNHDTNTSNTKLNLTLNQQLHLHNNNHHHHNHNNDNSNKINSSGKYRSNEQLNTAAADTNSDYLKFRKYLQLKSKLFDDYLILPNYLNTTNTVTTTTAAATSATISAKSGSK